MKSALVVLFNQDFSRNIPKLQKVYQGRFDEIVYIVPDHCSKFHKWYLKSWMPTRFVRALDAACNLARRLMGRKNPFQIDPMEARKYQIHRVVGDQFYFYDFITQTAKEILALESDWVWIVGDDAVLHPSSSGNSLIEQFVRNDEDCVLCQPVLGSDHWLTRIAGSPENADHLVRLALKQPLNLAQRHGVEPEPGANRNKSVPVACADFLGVRRDVLQRALPMLDRCLDLRLYVEIGFPIAMLATSGKPAFIDRFIWEREKGPSDWKEMAANLVASDAVFSHPIKLSTASMNEIAVLRGVSSDASEAFR